nr:cytochrome P450 2L1-like [Cherax quadricarinatus]
MNKRMIDKLLPNELSDSHETPQTKVAKKRQSALVTSKVGAKVPYGTGTIWHRDNWPRVPMAQGTIKAQVPCYMGYLTVQVKLERKLQYLEAVIHEVLRISSVIPISLSHCVTKDIELGGYVLPKGMILQGCSVTSHEDPSYWQNPENFNPDRFLDESGKFVSQKEGFFPFGIGVMWGSNQMDNHLTHSSQHYCRRQCLGESLARMELFIFSAALLQNFSFSPPTSKQIDLSPQNIPFSLFPKYQDIVITIRK